MKKRLSDSPWYLPTILLGCVGIMVFLSSILRAVSLAGRYGIVEAEIPVLSVPLEEDSIIQKSKTSSASLGSLTPMILLNREAFVFGTIDSFTIEISSVRNKFYIPHHEGSPNLPELVKDIKRWTKESHLRGKKINDQTVLLLPQEDIPVSIIIQCIDGLRQSKLFEKVILAGGIL